MTIGAPGADCAPNSNPSELHAPLWSGQAHPSPELRSLTLFPQPPNAQPQATGRLWGSQDGRHSPPPEGGGERPKGGGEGEGEGGQGPCGGGAHGAVLSLPAGDDAPCPCCCICPQSYLCYPPFHVWRRAVSQRRCRLDDSAVSISARQGPPHPTVAHSLWLCSLSLPPIHRSPALPQVVDLLDSSDEDVAPGAVDTANDAALAHALDEEENGGRRRSSRLASGAAAAAAMQELSHEFAGLRGAPRAAGENAKTLSL